MRLNIALLGEFEYAIHRSLSRFIHQVRRSIYISGRLPTCEKYGDLEAGLRGLETVQCGKALVGLTV
jgi:hypothetical protein